MRSMADVNRDRAILNEAQRIVEWTVKRIRDELRRRGIKQAGRESIWKAGKDKLAVVLARDIVVG